MVKVCVCVSKCVCDCLKACMCLSLWFFWPVKSPNVHESCHVMSTKNVLRINNGWVCSILSVM